MSEIKAPSRQVAEQWARDAFARQLGTVVRVSYVMGYKDDHSHEWYAPAGETIAVRILPTDDGSLTHWNDDHLDPYWDVEIIERPDFIPADAASFWIDGPAFTVARSRMASTISGTAAAKTAKESALRLVAIDLAASLAHASPGFDQARFMRAAGFATEAGQ